MNLLNYSELSQDELKQVDRTLITSPEDQQAYYEALEAYHGLRDDEPDQQSQEEISPDVKDKLESYILSELPKVDTERSLGDLSFTLDDLIEMSSEKYKVSPDMVKTLIDEAVRELSLKVTAEISSWHEKDGTVCQSYFENNPERGIRLITKKTPREGGTIRYHDDIIISYYLEYVSKTVNPLEPGDIAYTVRLRHCRKRGSVLSYEDEDIGSIAAHVGMTAPGIRSKVQLHNAISSIIDALDEEGQVNEQSRIPATGFFEYNGALHWSDSKLFKCSLPDYSHRQTKRALYALEKIADFYAVRGVKDGDHLRHFLPVLYFIVQAPLSVTRKVKGGEAKVLLLHGQTHVGKTYLEKMSCAIWGIPEQSGIIGAARLTGPQYAEAVNRCTLPISLDESRNALSSPAIADLIKSSTMNLMIKNRITRDFKMKSFMAYAAVIMSTNFVPELYAGMSDRLISVEFTKQHKRDESAIRTFETFFNGDGKLILPHVGSGLRELYLKKWETCKRLMGNEDQLKAGRELFKMLYKEHGLPVPDWMKEISSDDNRPEEDDPLKIIFDWMKDDLLRILRQYRRADAIPLTWSDRLDAIQSDNIRPKYIQNISKKNLMVTREILTEIARIGFEIPGGLTGLMHIVNEHDMQDDKMKSPSNYQGVKSLKINRNVFLYYAELTEGQTEIE